MRIGIDVGGTNLKAGLVDEEGKILTVCRAPVGQFTDGRDFARILAELALKAAAQGGVRPGKITGVGIGIAASKVKGTRVCTCSDVYSAELSKRHNNSNILTMGARVVGIDLAKMIATHWLTAEFEGGRHQRRIDEITAIENGEEL